MFEVAHLLVEVVFELVDQCFLVFQESSGCWLPRRLLLLRRLLELGWLLRRLLELRRLLLELGWLELRGWHLAGLLQTRGRRIEEGVVLVADRQLHLGSWSEQVVVARWCRRWWVCKLNILCFGSDDLLVFFPDLVKLLLLGVFFILISLL